MKNLVSFIMCLWVIISSLQGEVIQSVKINITPASYIRSSTEQEMKKWLQRKPHESVIDYGARISEANKTAIRKQFEAEATAKYKRLFIRYANWHVMQIVNYNHNNQTFLIRSEVCADFMMPVPFASASAFEAEFTQFQLSNPDFYFEGDIVKFSRLTFKNSKKATYIYDITNKLALPSITWIFPFSSEQDVSEKDLKIQACVKSSSQIMNVSVSVNGQVSRGIAVVKNDGYNFSVNQDIALVEGINEMTIVVENKVGKSVSEVRYVNYQPVNTVASHYTYKRLALVIGNAAYIHYPLANPVNDANDIAAKLKNLGFDVMLLTDTSKEQIECSIDYFGRKAKDYDVAMFFYAGHAIQYNNKNYMIPVNIPLSNGDEEWKVAYDYTPVDRVLTSLEHSKCKFKLVVLDACRNDLFRNLAGNKLSPMMAPTGTFIAYSTSPNEKALDGTGRNSPYTAELLKWIDTKQLKIEDLFKKVRVGVLERTNGLQLSWEQSSIVGEFFFNH